MAHEEKRVLVFDQNHPLVQQHNLTAQWVHQYEPQIEEVFLIASTSFSEYQLYFTYANSGVEAKFVKYSKSKSPKVLIDFLEKRILDLGRHKVFTQGFEKLARGFFVPNEDWYCGSTNMFCKLETKLGRLYFLGERDKYFLFHPDALTRKELGLATFERRVKERLHDRCLKLLKGTFGLPAKPESWQEPWQVHEDINEDGFLNGSKVRERETSHA